MHRRTLPGGAAMSTAVLLSDEGQELSVPTHDTSNYGTTAQLTPHRLFYIGPAGGLYFLQYRNP